MSTISDIWEISRRGSLGQSFVGVTSGKGLVYIGVDQPALAARELAGLNARIATGTSSSPIAAAETRPYSDFLAQRAANEETFFADSPEIAIVIDDGYAYLHQDQNGFDKYVRVQSRVAAA